MSCGPTAAELAQIRADVAAIALDIDCTIQRATTAKDAWGTETETWSTIATLKAGMKSPKPAVLEAYADRIGAKLAWEVNFTYGTDVREQDHLIIGTDTMVVQANLSVQSYPSLTTVLATETI
jgi:hypothetical protein